MAAVAIRSDGTEKEREIERGKIYFSEKFHNILQIKNCLTWKYLY